MAEEVRDCEPPRKFSAATVMMAMKVCLSVSTLNYPQGGGHRWVFLNWALGLQCNGCEVTWLDAIDRRTSAEQIEERLKGLRAAISPYGFGQCICLSSREGTPLP